MSFKTKFKHFLYNNELGKDFWGLMHTININLRRVIPNELYFKRAYVKTHGESPDFKNPRTFDEKQLWLKMNYRNPLCTKCSDKYLVREFVKEKGLEHILNPLFGVYDSAKSINWDELPDRFYIKANHMSACNVRCNDLSTFDKKSAEKILGKGMKHDYSLDSREWNYRDIDRKIIAEAIIETDDSLGLVDYRFLCSKGKCEYIFVDIDTADDSGNHRHDARRNIYDNEFNLLDITASRPNFDPSLISKPENFEEMLKYAQILSKEFPFCRVDFYNVDGKIIFGEITFFHAGGTCDITPKEWQYKIGDSIDISEELKNFK